MQIEVEPRNVKKYAAIQHYLRDAIMKGQYRSGDRLPSEQQLVHRFSASRPTVARALRELQNCGMVERRVGSGTYVLDHNKSSTAAQHMFGLLVPELGRTEIFEPICGHIARCLQSHRHMLLWGDFGGTTDPEGRIDHAVDVCEQYISRGVSGVFLAPVELTPRMKEINQQLIKLLNDAQLPVVLLDRDLASYPERSQFDLVGIDNWQGGFRLAQHLISQGCRRIGFFARPRSASTVLQRIGGFRQGVFESGDPHVTECVLLGDPDDAEFVKASIERHQLDGVACANDLTAGHLLHTLSDLGFDIPRQIRITGFDDVKYASLVRVPLTTMHQPCDEIAAVAVNAMLDRLANPDLPTRTILVEAKLVVRRSCHSNTTSSSMK